MSTERSVAEATGEGAPASLVKTKHQEFREQQGKDGISQLKTRCHLVAHKFQIVKRAISIFQQIPFVVELQGNNSWAGMTSENAKNNRAAKY